jgi:hypothetical protein
MQESFMRSFSRRKIIKGSLVIAGVAIIAGFPKLFTPALGKGDPPHTKPTKKTVSKSKPDKNGDHGHGDNDRG